MADRMQLGDHSIARMVRALAIPCHAITLLLIVLFSLLFWIAASGGLLGIPLAALLTSWFLKYAFALLDSVSEGDREPPVLSYEMINPLAEQRPLATAVLLYLLYLATQRLDGWAGSGAGGIARTALALCVPAIVAVQGISGRFWTALNPRAWLELIVRLRWSYALILIVVGLVWMLAQGAFKFTPAVMLPFVITLPLGQLARLAIVMYGWLALHAFIGAVVFERRDAIDFDPSRSPERLAEREQRERDKDLDLVIDRIFAEWRGGAHGNAWRTVEAHLQQSSNRLAALTALFERIARWPDPRLGNLLAHELLPGLLAARRTGDALMIVRDRLRADPAFRPQQASDALRMAELARDAGDRHIARQLLSDFAERFPNDPAQMTVARLKTELAR